MKILRKPEVTETSGKIYKNRPWQHLAENCWFNSRAAALDSSLPPLIHSRSHEFQTTSSRSTDPEVLGFDLANLSCQCFLSCFNHACFQFLFLCLIYIYMHNAFLFIFFSYICFHVFPICVSSFGVCVLAEYERALKMCVRPCSSQEETTKQENHIETYIL